MLVDVGASVTGDAALLIEDGLKFLGILAWTQYFAITARDIAASTIAEALSRPNMAEPTNSTEIGETAEAPVLSQAA